MYSKKQFVSGSCPHSWALQFRYCPCLFCSRCFSFSRAKGQVREGESEENPDSSTPASTLNAAHLFAQSPKKLKRAGFNGRVDSAPAGATRDDSRPRPGPFRNPNLPPDPRPSSSSTSASRPILTRSRSNSLTSSNSRRRRPCPPSSSASSSPATTPISGRVSLRTLSPLSRSLSVSRFINRSCAVSNQIQILSIFGLQEFQVL